MTVVEKITELRKAKGMTCQELAKKSGVSAATISHWNKGRTKPNPVLLKKIADALGCDYEILYKLL